MLSARLARFGLLGLLVTGTAYAADSSEIDPEKAAAPAQAAVEQAPAPQPVAAGPEAAAPAQAALEQAPAPQPVAAGPDEAATAENVGRATITTGIMDREPVDSVDTVTNDQEQIFFFTEILNLTGGTITHRWEYNGEIMAEVPLDIGGPRWRTHSSKRFFAGWLGEWKVSVVDDSGQILSSATFNYVPANTPAAIQKD